MDNDVIFEDYTIDVVGEMNSCIISALDECAGAIVNQTVRNSNWIVGNDRVGAAWTHHVNENEMCAYIGNPMEASLWEEFGTGEHALHGDGRKGYWVYVKGGNSNARKSTKHYTEKEAKQRAAALRAQGLDAYYTNGRDANRPFFHAYQALKSNIIERLQNALAGL